MEHERTKILEKTKYSQCEVCNTFDVESAFYPFLKINCNFFNFCKNSSDAKKSIYSNIM